MNRRWHQRDILLHVAQSVFGRARAAPAARASANAS